MNFGDSNNDDIEDDLLDSYESGLDYHAASTNLLVIDNRKLQVGGGEYDKKA